MNSEGPSIDLPFITYAPRGRGGGGGVKSPIHFHCILVFTCRKGGGGQIAAEIANVLNERPLGWKSPSLLYSFLIHLEIHLFYTLADIITM